MSSARRYLSVFATVGLLALTLPLSATPVLAESAATVPSGFRDELVWSGLTSPTNVLFAPSGKVFVSLKNGKIFVYDSMTDSSATTLIDLSSDVYNYWDRGLLGFAMDPDFPTRPYLYALYTYDYILGDSTPAPRWGGTNPGDSCPTPPGGNNDGCLVSGRLERLTVSSGGTGNSISARKTLITDWCAQFPSHSIGALAFGPEDALYVSGGDGASFNEADWGQLGGASWSNPCGDPNNQGGALRSQDLRSTSDATSLDGTILRVDPDTGDAWGGNANAGNSDPNIARIIAYGLRNPFRFTVRPNGNVWIGDVGWEGFEEINKITDPDAAAKNFGWPCYEANGTTAGYSGLSFCQSLSSQSGPTYDYYHGDEIVGGDGCGTGSSSVSGMAFLPSSSNYPTSYDNGLFFTDYSRKCIWFAPDNGGNPDFGNISLFADLRRSSGSEIDGGSVFLGITPDGDLIYTDYNRNEVRAVRYYPPNAPPSAAFSASPDNGPVPMAVVFDASQSDDSNGDTLAYAWDLDGDGQYDDATGKVTSRTYTQAGDVNVGLRVTDDGVPPLEDTIHETITPGNLRPVIDWPTPPSNVDWDPGDTIAFSATASDEDGSIDASGFSWRVLIDHGVCPACHTHEIEVINDVESGSFVAPTHSNPWTLRLELTVTDDDGLSTVMSRTLKLPYSDIANNAYVDDIVWLYDRGKIANCGSGKYCPTSTMTRGTLAVFLAKALSIPATANDYFTDDNGSKYELYINRLAAAGIVSGCGTKKYCPNSLVTRGQMASYLAKAFHLPTTSTDYFTDDNNSVHEKNINRVTKAGVMSGCSSSKFCLDSLVNRGQLARYLYKALR